MKTELIATRAECAELILERGVCWVQENEWLWLSFFASSHSQEENRSNFLPVPSVHWLCRCLLSRYRFPGGMELEALLIWDMNPYLLSPAVALGVSHITKAVGTWVLLPPHNKRGKEVTEGGGISCCVHGRWEQPAWKDWLQPWLKFGDEPCARLLSLALHWCTYLPARVTGLVLCCSLRGCV